MNRSRCSGGYCGLVPACVIFALACFAADTLTLTDGTVVTGAFEKFSAGAFYIKAPDGKTVKESLLKVQSLELDPVTTVNAKPRAGKRMENAKFKGYKKPKFLFEDGGREVAISGTEMSLIEIGLDFARAMQLAGTGKDPEAAGESFDIESSVKPGAITIVHFYAPALRPLQQPDNYVVRLRDEKKIELVQVDIKAWDSPVARQYDIKTVPQFWVYDKQAKLFTNLVERFTGVDIDNAIKAAKRR